MNLDKVIRRKSPSKSRAPNYSKSPPTTTAQHKKRTKIESDSSQQHSSILKEKRKTLFGRQMIKIVGKKKKTTKRGPPNITAENNNHSENDVNKEALKSFKQLKKVSSRYGLITDPLDCLKKSRIMIAPRMRTKSKRISFNSRRKTCDFRCFERDEKQLRFSGNVRNRLHKSKNIDDDCETDDEQMAR